MFAQPANCLTHMHVDLLFEYFIHVLHALSITSVITYCAHAFTELLAFNFLSMSQANLGSGSAFTKATLHILGKEGSPSSPDLCINSQNWPPRPFFTFLQDSHYLAQEIGQICPWANSSSQIESCIA